MRVILIGLLFLFQIHCGDTTSENFLSGNGGSNTVGGVGGSVAKGVSIEGNVTVPISMETTISIGSDSSETLSISKSVTTTTSADEGEVCCKRYDGVTVANGSVDSSGEIVETVVYPSTLDETEQVLCEAKLTDGQTVLNHYDLTHKTDGDRVRVDFSSASTSAAKQVLSECGQGTTFENMAACTPVQLFESWRLTTI